MMEATRHSYSGWFYWMWRDQPKATDLTSISVTRSGPIETPMGVRE